MKDINVITEVSNAVASKLVAGMLWSPVADPITHKNFFPTGTFIASVNVSTGLPNTSTITMSAAAVVDGPNQATNPFSWTFIGSKYTSATGSTDGNNSNPYISSVDPSVGLILRPGMLVVGQNIAPNTFVGPFTPNGNPNYSQVNLVDQNGNPIATVPTGSGPYTFVGAPDSYIVQTLVNNWYAWADYYVRNQATPLPAGGLTSTTGNTYGSQTSPQYPLDGRKNPKSLILYNIDPTVYSKLHVGDVVTRPPSPTLPERHPRCQLRLQPELHHRELTPQVSRPIGGVDPPHRGAASGRTPLLDPSMSYGLGRDGSHHRDHHHHQ